MRHAVLLLAVLCSACSGLLFQPTDEWAFTPDQFKLEYQNIMLPMDDGVQLNAWVVEPRQATEKGVFLFFHGNAQNISLHFPQVLWLVESGYEVVLLDYRGYGKSTGTPHLISSLEDIEHVVQWFLMRYPDEKRYVFAQSLGASMSGYVLGSNPALAHAFDAIVLDSGFSSYQQITREVLSRSWLTWLLQYPASWGMPSALDMVDVVDNIAPTPLLVVHGTEDRVVPFHHGEAVFQAAHEPKAFLRYEGHHIAAFNNEVNQQLMLDFLQAITEKKDESANP